LFHLERWLFLLGFPNPVFGQTLHVGELKVWRRLSKHVFRRPVENHEKKMLVIVRLDFIERSRLTEIARSSWILQTQLGQLKSM